MQPSAQQYSVRNLENLYTIVAGVGLFLAITNVVDPDLAPMPVHTELLPYFLVYITILIPFFHGALRHLDRTYIELQGRELGEGVLLVDFIGLFVESCLFVSIAALLPSPQLFAFGLVVLITVDILWALFAHFSTHKIGEPHAELRWAFINLIYLVLLLFLFLLILKIFPPISHVPLSFGGAWIMFLITLVRSVMDYWFNWKFYYPSPPV